MARAEQIRCCIEAGEYYDRQAVLLNLSPENENHSFSAVYSSRGELSDIYYHNCETTTNDPIEIHLHFENGNPNISITAINHASGLQVDTLGEYARQISVDDLLELTPNKTRDRFYLLMETNMSNRRLHIFSINSWISPSQARELSYSKTDFKRIMEITEAKYVEFKPEMRI
ncbi:MAG: hypothetical protein M1365_01515 [Actinobacteria bacterium]|nr:hypothetical protein [Actinomycetota bacterium]